MSVITEEQKKTEQRKIVEKAELYMAGKIKLDVHGMMALDERINEWFEENDSFFIKWQEWCG